MFDQTSLLDLLSATSSPELECGPTPCAAPVGPTIVRSGPDRARASLSARQAREKGLLTSVTCCPRSSTSSSSASLQSSLENRLRAAALAYGSILYKLTWKQWATPSGLSRFRLRASAARTSEIALSGWPTPTVGNAAGSQSFEGLSATGRTPDGRKVSVALPHLASMAGWPTPKACDSRGDPYEPQDGCRRTELRKFASLAGWPTPRATDGDKGSRTADGAMSELSRGKLSCLPGLSAIATPLRLCSDGTLLTGSSAGMESGGRLDPAHSRWLMRLPPVWDDCAVTAMQSMPKRSRRSSAR